MPGLMTDLRIPYIPIRRKNIGRTVRVWRESIKGSLSRAGLPHPFYRILFS
jgi:hypothetical protein